MEPKDFRPLPRNSMETTTIVIHQPSDPRLADRKRHRRSEIGISRSAPDLIGILQLHLQLHVIVLPRLVLYLKYVLH